MTSWAGTEHYRELLVDAPAEHVVRVTLDRPQKANALSSRLLDELDDVVRRVEADDDVRVWLLTGSDRTDGRPWFSAGVDLEEAMAGPVERGSDPAALCDRIDEMLKPSIAVIGGLCTTGALELVLACDLRLAGTSARLSDWHLSRTGLGIGAWGMAARLSRLVGVDKAKELVLLGNELDGEAAARIGLVNAAVPDADLVSTALEWAGTIASRPRRGVRTTLGYLATQVEMSKHEAIHWAERTPGFMGVQLRPFADAADRWSRERDAGSS
jgi:enoyl-CoA hydratase/carnithine racemase